MTPEARLEAAGVILNRASRPVAAYVPVVVSRGRAFVSGHGPLTATGQPLYTGRLGRQVDQQQAEAAVRLTAAYVLGALSLALGGLDRVERIDAIRIFVAADSFAAADTEQLAEAATALFETAFGGVAGQPAITFVPITEAVFGVPITIDAVVSVVDPHSPEKSS